MPTFDFQRTIEIGNIIDADDYNELADAINLFYHDLYPVNSHENNKVLNLPNGYGDQNIRTLSTNLTSNSFIVVFVDDKFIEESGNYSLNINDNSINLFSTLDDNLKVEVFDRTREILGWGQDNKSVRIDLSDIKPLIIADDDTAFQAYINTNINHIVDKVNLMNDRTGLDDTELSRASSGDLIYAEDKIMIQNRITEVIEDEIYYTNENPTIVGSSARNSRVNTWINQISLTWKWEFLNYNHCRYYFNSGGEITCGVEVLDLTNVNEISNDGINNWIDAINQSGIITMNHLSTSNIGGDSNTTSGLDVGFYSLSTEWQDISRSVGADPSSDDKEETERLFLQYPHLFEIDNREYSDYRVPVQVLYESRLVPDSPSTGNYSIEIRITLNNRVRISSINTDIHSFAGYNTPAKETNNTARYSMTAPNVAIVDGFNDSTDI